MKRILVLFCVMMLLNGAACAQVGSSGHFAFDVPDDWEYLNYDGREGWYAGDGVLFLFETDFTKYGLFDQKTIMDMYCKSKDIETEYDEFKYEELNGDLVAYYTQEKGNYLFEYYKNGYVLTMLYGSKSKDTAKAEEALRRIAATVRYDVQAQSGYRMNPKETAYFSFGIPEGWSFLEEDGKYYAFNGDVGETHDGYYFVSDTAMAGLEQEPEESIRALMEYMRTAYTDTLDFFGEEYAQHLTIDGAPAYLCHGYGRKGSFIYTSIMLCAKADRMLMCMYMNAEEAFDKNMHTGLIEALAAQVKPL